jgi:hypothetical protein
MRNVKIGPVRALGRGRREAFQRAVDTYHQNLPAFHEEFDSKFSSLYEIHQRSDEVRRAKNAEHYREYEKTVETTPRAGAPEPERPAAAALSAVSFRARGASTGPSGRPSAALMKTSSVGAIVPVEPPATPSVFPRLRNGWRSPGTAEIRMCLEELELIFPLDVDRKLFCGISEDDPDIEAQKVFLFNVIHLLTLISEFTGMIYDVRITMADGWYRLEDRLTGMEIKRDTITSKTLMANPYRASVLACLKKLTIEFHLQPRQQDFISCIDSVLHFHTLLVDAQGSDE